MVRKQREKAVNLAKSPGMASQGRQWINFFLPVVTICGQSPVQRLLGLTFGQRGRVPQAGQYVWMQYPF